MSSAITRTDTMEEAVKKSPAQSEGGLYKKAFREAADKKLASMLGIDPSKIPESASVPPSSEYVPRTRTRRLEETEREEERKSRTPIRQEENNVQRKRGLSQFLPRCVCLLVCPCLHG